MHVLVGEGEREMFHKMEAASEKAYYLITAHICQKVEQCLAGSLAMVKLGVYVWICNSQPP